MAHTSMAEQLTVISPAMRRELAEVRSMRTATSSHSSPEVEVSVGEVGVPPNHQTIGREVEVGGERGGDFRRREKCCDRRDDSDDSEVDGAEDEEKAEAEGV
mmetsp:Transcript_11409/g.24057  ORF Transcript_11409/g.24057 Transcript_11409/m.24057 type:complete len:102 (+) Transcript_11409:1642-1947(+)